MFYPPNVRRLLALALEEDLGQGDVVGDALRRHAPHQAQQHVQLHVVPRQSCVLSALELVSALIHVSGLSVEFHPLLASGEKCPAGSPMGYLTGRLVEVLALERTILNFLQHLCGVATITSHFVEAVSGTSTKITHTRKTLPAWRYLEQQAVLDGGGVPHRYNLSHTAMFKDNLLQTVRVTPQELSHWILKRLPHTAKLEMECDSLAQIPEALSAHAEVILLDNMTLDEIQSAVQIIAGRAVIEVSGGMTLNNVKAYAEAGADIISSSQITLGAPPIDIGLDLYPL